MCGPVVLDAASGISKAMGSAYAGKVEKAVAYANADMAEQNAKYANQQAADAITRGSFDVAQQYLKVGDLEGQQIAASAANGVELGFGSQLETVADTAALGEIDASTIRRNAAREAEGYRIQSINYQNQANTFRLNGTAAGFAGTLGAVGSILGSASQVSKDITSAFMGGG